MRKISSTLFALLLMAASTSTLKAQQSDYEIQQDFRSDYEQIVNWIDNAVASSDLVEIEDRVNEFINDYSDHVAIINSALYPETVSEKIEDLRARFEAAREKIAAIEELEAEIEQLNAEFEDFRGQLAAMDERIEGFQQQIREGEESERRISAIAEQRRQLIVERDRFVTEFLTQLLERYEAVDASTREELAEVRERLDENPVDLLRTILGEYVNYANQATGLSTPEYLSMKAQYVYLSEWWDDIGERLTDEFEGDEPVQAHQEVTDLLANWYSAIDNRIWGTISDAFAENNLNLDSFGSSDQLYNAIQSYVDEATETAREQNDEEDLERFRAFSNFWNGTVKEQWGDQMIASQVLNFSHIASIDQQLEGWGEEAIPVSNLMLILFLVSVAVIIGLIVALVRKKGGSEAGTTA